MVIINGLRYNSAVDMDKESCKYTPYYCEENIWHLCQAPCFEEKEGYVLFISNPSRQCIFYKQQLAGTAKIVVWDYHVIFVSFFKEWLAWDLDTVLPFPCPFPEYLSKTFPPSAPDWAGPLFKFIPAREFADSFFSDRSHMLDSDGGYTHAPPYWPPIRPEKGAGIYEYISMTGRNSTWTLEETIGGLWCPTRRPF